MIKFKHIFNFKTIAVLNKEEAERTGICAILHGAEKEPVSRRNPIECIWLVLPNVPNPLPVAESEEEVMTLLGIK